MDDRVLALLGDREAAERLTAAGVLLECPFCGGNAEEQDNWIFCITCGVGYEEFDPEESRKAWNTRAPILTPVQLALLKIGAEPRKFEEGENNDQR